MRYAILPLIPALACVLAAPGAAVAEDANTNTSVGNVQAFLGVKHLKKSEWEPVESHGELGVVMDFRGASWPISIAVDGFFSAAEEEEDDVDISAATQELHLGVRKVWEFGNHFGLGLGGGVAFISVQVEADPDGGGNKIDDDDSSTGFFAEVTPYARFGRFSLGGLLGVSGADDVKIFDDEVSPGGLHIGIVIGGSW